MRQESSVAERRLIAAGICATCALVLAQTIAELVDYRFFDLRLGVLRSDGDGGLFGAIGVIALLSTSAAAWLGLLRLPDLRRPLEILAPLVTFLAIDKGLRLHDHIPHWLALYLPLLAGVFLLLLAIARRTSLQARRLIVAALALLALAFLVHQYGDSVLVHLHEPSTGWAYQLKGVVKHGAELAGWLFVAVAIVGSCISASEK
jgi:hypothetical protein